MDEVEKMLKDVTEAPGIPGYEGPIRSVLLKYLDGMGEIFQDNLGSLICRKEGTAELPHVMLAAHMDEIGLLVKYITDEGYIRFSPLGGWFPQFMPGQRIIIKTRQGDVEGLIAMKIPFSPNEDAKKLIPIEEMFVDVGATSKEELIECGIRIGDPIVPRSDFTILSNKKTYLAKAWDDRVGVAMLVSIMQDLQTQPHPNSVYAAATVLEEMGTLGGAAASAEMIMPDVAFILEGVFAGDIPGMKPEDLNLKLGKGPGIIVSDWRVIPNLKLRDWVIETSQEIGVPFQLSTLIGFTDSAAVQLHKVGVPTIIIGVPARYIHSHNSIVHREDYDNAVKLLLTLIARLDAKMIVDFRS